MELLSFTAHGENDKVKLVWSTVTEVNNFGFNILQSYHWSRDFSRINETMIPSAGTSFERKDYAWTHDNLTNGVSYFYQLEAVDTGGGTSSSRTIAAVPHISDLAIRIGIQSNRRIYAVNDPMVLNGRILNSDSRQDVKLQVVMLLNGEYAGDVIAPTVVDITSGLDVNFPFAEHVWNCTEPKGTYVIATILRDPLTDELVHVDVSEFEVIF